MTPFALDLVSEVATTAPAPVVRATFEDAATWPAWCGPVVDVTEIPETWSAGERLVYRLQSLVQVSFDVRLDEVSDTAIRWSSTKGPITGIRTWTFAEGRITDTKRFESVLPVRWFYPRPPIRRMSERWLADLATEAERRAR